MLSTVLVKGEDSDTEEGFTKTTMTTLLTLGYCSATNTTES
jgi:hypothetical protein